MTSKSTLLFAVRNRYLNLTQARQLSLLYTQQTVRSSRTPRADQRSHVECAVGINVMIGDGKKAVNFKTRLIVFTLLALVVKTDYTNH